MALTKISRGLLNTRVSDSSDATAITIDSSEKVGLNGLSAGDYWSTSNQLVFGNTASGANGGMTIATATDAVGQIYFADGTSGDARYRGQIQYTHVSDAMDFATAGAFRMRIASDGDVGIGTDSPDVKLDVRGEAAIAYNATYGLRFYNQARSNWGSIGNDATNSGADLQFKSGSSGMNLLHAGEFQFNSGFGSIATAFGVRAWVRFRGDTSGTGNRQVDGSGNVSTVGYIAAGRYRMNFNNNMPDVHYAVAASGIGVANHNPISASIDSGYSTNVGYVDLAYGPSGGTSSYSIGSDAGARYNAIVVR